MALETATYINQLVATNPLGSDPIASGDDHIRLIKAALQATFPNLTGPVTVGQSVINNPFPTGGIIMWSGAISAIPSGWALCDGTNGTPNLRDRFVVGAGTSYAVGDTGGANSVTLSEAQIPSHTHTVSIGAAGAHNHSVNDPGHSHSLNGGPIYGQSRTGSGPSNTAGFAGGYPVGWIDGINASGTGISLNGVGDHTHSVSIGNTGGSQAHENRPPYYALAYIMKV